LQAAEKGLKRLWTAFEQLQKIAEQVQMNIDASDPEMDQRCKVLLAEVDEFMSDDLNTAKAMANFFELVPVINSIRDGHMPRSAIKGETVSLMLLTFKTYLVDIFGLRDEEPADGGILGNVMQLLIDIRKEARARKDFSTSDKIRNQLQAMGIQIKDERDGNMSWSKS
jgi:cysteinyl-tRNA synthetase